MKARAGIVATMLGFLLLASACGDSAEDVIDDVIDATTETEEHEAGDAVSDEVIAAQRAALAAASAEAGPQAPRDVDSAEGDNPVSFEAAPPYTAMNLCNIHFHEGAEHKGGEFTTYAGNGDGEGNGTGYLYDGQLTEAELTPFDSVVGESEHGDLVPGDTIEIHYVHTTDPVGPGPTLNSCLATADSKPLLRVEAQVYVLVNDPDAASLMALTELVPRGDGTEAMSLRDDLGTPVLYAGSTTGPVYNEKPSLLHVTWSVHPEVLKVDIASVAEWLEGNVFEEDHAHGVRNLVINPDLLSPIG